MMSGCGLAPLSGQQSQTATRHEAVLFYRGSMKNPKNVYLAGKIQKHGWREGIIGGVCNFNSYDIKDPFRSLDWPITENAILNYYNYTGPYFVSCDHGCSHGESTHGITGGVCFEHPPDEVMHSLIANECMKAIDKTDILLALIDSIDAFGTFAEIGYAVAKGIHIIILFSRELKEQEINSLWFLACMADAYRMTDDPTKDMLELLTFLKPKPKFNYHEYLLTPEWKAKADAAKEKAGHHCQLCNGDGLLHAHHRTYERIGHEDETDIIVLCANCHAKFHNKQY